MKPISSEPSREKPARPQKRFIERIFFIDSPPRDPEKSDTVIPAQTYTTRQLWEKLRRFIKPYYGILKFACLGNMIVVAIALTYPLFTKVLIDTVIPSKNILLACILGVTYFLLSIFNDRIAKGQAFLIHYCGAKIIFDIRCELFHHLQLLHLSYFENQKSSGLVNRVINDVLAIQQFIGTAFMTLTNGFFQLFFAMLVVFILNWKMALFCLAVLPVYFIVLRYYRTSLRTESHRIRESQARVAGTLGEVFSGIKVVKSFTNESWENERFIQLTKDNIRPELELNVLGLRMSTMLAGITNFVTAGLFIAGAWAVIGDTMTIGDYVAFTGYLGALFGPMRQLSGMLSVVVNAKTSVERIVDVLAIKPEIRDIPDAMPLPEVKGHIEFRDVTFSYGDDRPAVHDFTLDVRPGEMIAIVGPSGAGKSTLVNLLTRFYDVRSGEICVDGHDIRKVKYEDYRRNIGIVLQENFLFAGTIADNIRYGKPDANMEEIEAAADKANALEFVRELPDGFDSIIGERGIKLSGGQRQRLAIARALLKNPPILIFDEATSSLDTISEHLIQEALNSLINNRTVFVVAHRLSTIQRADRIVVLEQGRISEIGSHEELLKQGGIYSQMFRIQEVKPKVDLEIA